VDDKYEIFSIQFRLMGIFQPARITRIMRVGKFPEAGGEGGMTFWLRKSSKKTHGVP
jgi:hypothetical protein